MLQKGDENQLMIIIAFFGYNKIIERLDLHNLFKIINITYFNYHCSIK